jgi:two-component system cell cycle sensor histidine kinase/response regulator CckA
LTNLVVNARDAMPNGGKLVIETQNVVLDNFFVHEHAGASHGRQVMLAVSDSGIGMDMATQAHLFEPFFTTKGPGKGTGLGLATCYGIVKQHGGYIECYSKVGHGTSIRVYLPSLESEVYPAPQPSADNIMPHGTETILLVEDDIAVRGLTARLLTRLGYAVIEVVNGLEALQLVQSADDRAIDLVITDVVMPQMGGKMLATRLAELRPDLPVLFMSGYTDDALVEQGYLAPGIVFIQKPFSQTGLAYKVREALDQ